MVSSRQPTANPASAFRALLALALLVQHLSAACPLSQEWERNFNVTGAEYVPSVHRTSDAGYILGGYTTTGDTDMLLIKTNSSGEVEWNRTYGTSGWDPAPSSVQTSDEGYAIFGSSQNSTSGGYEALLVKTNSSGDMEWSARYHAGLDTDGRYLQQTPDGGFILAGSTDASGSFDAWLAKADSGGNLEWNRTFGSTGDDEAYFVIRASDGGYVLAGISEDSGGNSDMYIVKTDSGGNLEWNRTFGGADWDYGYSAVETPDGGFILAGESYSYYGGNNSALVVRVDSGGSEVWSNAYIQDGYGGAYSIVADADGNYAFAGYSGTGGGDWLAKIRLDGTMACNSTFAPGGVAMFYDLRQTPDGGYILLGYADDQIWLLKLASDAPSISLVPPTPGNGSTVNGSSIYVNVSADENLSSAFLELDGTNISMAVNGTHAYLNASVGNGSHSFKVYVSDVDGNWGVSGTVTFNSSAAGGNESAGQGGIVMKIRNKSLAKYTIESIVLDGYTAPVNLDFAPGQERIVVLNVSAVFCENQGDRFIVEDVRIYYSTATMGGIMQGGSVPLVGRCS